MCRKRADIATAGSSLNLFRNRPRGSGRGGESRLPSHLELVLLYVPLGYFKPQHFERTRNKHSSHSQGFQALAGWASVATGSSTGPGLRLVLRDPWGRVGDKPPSASSQVHSVSSYVPPQPPHSRSWTGRPLRPHSPAFSPVPTKARVLHECVFHPQSSKDYASSRNL